MLNNNNCISLNISRKESFLAIQVLIWRVTLVMRSGEMHHLQLVPSLIKPRICDSKFSKNLGFFLERLTRVGFYHTKAPNVIQYTWYTISPFIGKIHKNSLNSLSFSCAKVHIFNLVRVKDKKKEVNQWLVCHAEHFYIDSLWIRCFSCFHNDC